MIFQRDPISKGTQKTAKGCLTAVQKLVKGAERMYEGRARHPKGRVSENTPYISKLPINRPSGRYVDANRDPNGGPQYGYHITTASIIYIIYI